MTIAVTTNHGLQKPLPGTDEPISIAVINANMDVLSRALVAGSTMAHGTITADAPMLHTVTWNNGGVTFTVHKINATDTASAVGTLFADYQVAGVSKFSVRKDGLVTAAGGFSGTLTTAAQPNVTSLGALTALTLGADLVLSADAKIRRNTADASDSGRLWLAGGGDTGVDRGASVFLYGNEHASVGNLELAPGTPGKTRFLNGIVELGATTPGAVADSGILRMPNNTVVAWRNAGNTANGWLGMDTTDRLYMGPFATSGSAGAVATYLRVNFNGTEYKIALLAVA